MSEHAWTSPAEIRNFVGQGVVATIEGPEDSDRLEWRVTADKYAGDRRAGVIASGTAYFMSEAKALCEGIIKAWEDSHD